MYCTVLITLKEMQLSIQSQEFQTMKISSMRLNETTLLDITARSQWGFAKIMLEISLTYMKPNFKCQCRILN